MEKEQVVSTRRALKKGGSLKSWWMSRGNGKVSGKAQHEYLLGMVTILK